MGPAATEIGTEPEEIDQQVEAFLILVAILHADSNDAGADAVSLIAGQRKIDVEHVLRRGGAIGQNGLCGVVRQAVLHASDGRAIQ